MPPNQNMANYDAEMPNTYDNNMQQQQSGGGIINKEYLRTIPGIIRSAELINCVVCLICAAVWETNSSLTGGGWLNFVAVVSLVFCLILFIFELFRIHQKLINLLNIWATIEFFTFVVFDVSWLIAAIVACAYATVHPSIGASAFFAFVGCGLFCTDTYFAFVTYRATPRGGGGGGGSSAPPAGTAGPAGIPDPAQSPGPAY